MELLVLLFILLILIMSGVAWKRHFQSEFTQTYFAVWGATLFILSEVVLAWKRFKVKFKSTQLSMLGTYILPSWHSQFN